MGTISETTTPAQIEQKIIEVDGIQKTAIFLVSQLSDLKTKLKLDLSADCSELGNIAEIIKDCRDKIIDAKIKGLVDLIANLGNLIKLLGSSSTNKEFNKIMSDN